MTTDDGGVARSLGILVTSVRAQSLVSMVRIIKEWSRAGDTSSVVGTAQVVRIVVS